MLLLFPLFLGFKKLAVIKVPCVATTTVLCLAAGEKCSKPSSSPFNYILAYFGSFGTGSGKPPG